MKLIWYIYVESEIQTEEKASAVTLREENSNKHLEVQSVWRKWAKEEV
jgi:hypothetical protein